MSHDLHSIHLYDFDQNFRRRFGKDQSNSKIENWDILEVDFRSTIQNPIWIHFSIIQNSTSQYWDNRHLRKNNFNNYLKNRDFLFDQYSWYIQLKFIGKENPIWAREDLIKKFCFQIELVWRQDIRTAQNINNKGWDSLMTETCQKPF